MGVENLRMFLVCVVSVSVCVYVMFFLIKVNGVGFKIFINFGIIGKGKVDCVVYFGIVVVVEIIIGLCL